MTDQEKRDRIIKALKAHVSGAGCGECPYEYYHECHRLLAVDTLAMLNEQDQESRVMSLDEVKNSRVEIWLETTDSFCGWGFSGEIDNSQEDTYGKTWRCWTSRPTDEQREAIPWEG